ncbi:hypothetical protein PHYPSEUDO_008175 [Phytophthora pseudosyringae]|uniref:Uncharacterized protein n=1 Tax=Phytophthora pseudosyringae TaxID=221518 RepID=A0A8T1W9V0_9STRA|nr:hypothetical protein PHYPSEUDO_008175 [Phytophthora pseudosyringae]
MLGGIFHKRKKNQELRTPSLQDLKKFRDAYAKYAELRQVETPPCFEKSIYKAIAGQKELHTIEFRQEDITDPQMIALAEALLEMPIVSSLDLRDNRITDDGAKALLEVLRLQIIAAKTPPTIDPRTKQPLYPPLSEYTRYVTNVNLKGNEVSASVLQELLQYVDVLRREDKRLEIRAALSRIDRNNDGGIDEEEFKGVLKLLTASTPTKKEIRAFMQQHTLSTDSTQNVVNLENVLLAKCAVSPSRHSACPPWEALVQERHAVLGAPRMAPTMISSAPESRDPSPSKARFSRPSLTSSGGGMVTGSVNPVVHSNSFSDVSPVSSPSSQVAPVAPIESMNAVIKPPPAPVINGPVVLQQPQATTKVSESKSAALTSDQPTTFTRPPQIPILPLASVMQHVVSPSPRSARSSVDDDGHRNSTKLSVSPSPRSTRSTVDDEGQRNASLIGPSPVVSAPSSPHDSDISDSMSAVSSAFGGSVSLRILEDHGQSSGTERKAHTATTLNPAPTTLDSPRWQSEHFAGEDDEGATSSGVMSATREEADELSIGEVDDDVRSAAIHRPPKSIITSASNSNELSDNKTVTGPSRHEASFSGNETPRELLTKGNEFPSGGHDEKRSLPGSVASTPRFDDLSSLVYRGAEEGGRAATFNSNAFCPLDQPEEDEEVEERVDSLMFDVTKDGKERAVVKLIHSEFRSGLTVKDFPAEVPFRNMLALLLPENGLSDLILFTACRFPFVTVLDLSRNKLTKLSDDALTAFPRLEVLDLANNQLKSITGLTKTLKVRALGLGHNAIRTVKNVEHLVQLEILHLAYNQIATVHALRLLSLNNVLAHLNLDGNPVVETDERQKRKNIVHVRNLLPALQSLGSIPCAGLHSKDKKKANSNAAPGVCLFDSDLMPDYTTLWVSTACDTLHISQDAKSQSSSHSQQDDDEWGMRDEDGGNDQPKRPLTREQQRQKDELRSRAVGFRSRGKAMPSPPKVKTSAYSFGPSQPHPANKRKKKQAPADPSVVREQQRRASELSAPKHAPVDKTMMHQEQKRKSWVDFHGAMTVGERLQLARDMTQRRPTASVGLSDRSRSILAKVASRKRASVAFETPMHEEEATGPEVNSESASRSPSPQCGSPFKDAMVFRIDPVNTPRSPKGVLSFRVDPYPAGMSGQPNSPKTTGSKEAGFLHDLAVSDFLNHAEEEFSTALTALNVLLSMSEKEQVDRKKLTDYRASLDALDILNEHESHELFNKTNKTQGHHEHELQAQCTEWFNKLGVVKKCMRQLLEKLEGHAPGSGVIRAYCRCLRSNELRGIITTTLETQEDAINQPNSAEDIEAEKEGSLLETEHGLPRTDEKPNQAEPASGSVTSRLFRDTPSLSQKEDNSTSHTPETTFKEGPTGGDGQTLDFSAGDDDLDFLKSTDSVFGEEKTLDVKVDEPVPPQSADGTTGIGLGIEDHASVSDPALLAATTDITMDIQMDDLADSNQTAGETARGIDTAEDNDNASAAEIPAAIEDENHTDEVMETYGGEGHDPITIDEAGDDMAEPAEATTTQNEDYDWLATSAELDAETTEADSFEQEMAAVSGDEGDDEVVQEQAEADQDYDWSNTEATEPTIEEGDEISEEVYNGETYEAEETNESGEVEENGEYSGGDEVATEDAEATEAQYELGEGVDADDEEAETFGDWEKGFDPNSNHYFWFNHSTGESSWTAPDGWPHEVDEPFSAENEASGGGEQPEQEYEYEEGASDTQEYEETGTEGQANDEGAVQGQYYEEGDEAADGQYYEEGAAEGQYYEEGAPDGQVYEEGEAEGQYDEEFAVEGQEYEGAASGQAYEEGTSEEQQYEETATDGQWYDEAAAEGQEYATEDQNYEVAAEEEQVEQAGEESPRRSEVSDFEFDDSDLPGF